MILRSHTKNNRLVIHEDEAQIKTTLPRRNKSKNQDSHHEKVTVPVEQSVIKATSDARDTNNDKQASRMQWTLKQEPNDLLLGSMPLEEAIRIPALYDFYDWDYADFVEEDPLPLTDLSDKEITEHSISIDDLSAYFDSQHSTASVHSTCSRSASILSSPLTNDHHQYPEGSQHSFTSTPKPSYPLATIAKSDSAHRTLMEPLVS